MEDRLKVVHILEGFLGGTSTYMTTVLPELVLRGFDVTLVCSVNRSCPDASARISGLRAAGVKVHIVPMYRKINPLKDFYSFARVLRLLLMNRYDIVHTHCSKAGALGRIAALVAGKKVRLHTPHCFAFTRCNGRVKKSVYLTLEKLLGRFTTGLVTVSSSEAEAAISSRIVPGHKCTRISNALSNGEHRSDSISSHDKPAVKTSLGIGENSRVVTTACRLVEYKGIFRFLEAAKLSQTPETTFVIAGDGELEEPAKRFISENRLEGKVKLLGHISNMEEIYSISDIVVLCSDAEAQPYLLLEAMRARCPIAATSVIGNRELISDNETGLLTAPTAKGVAVAVDELLADREKCNQYAQNAYAYFYRHHRLDKQISELTEMYKGFNVGAG